MKSVDFHTEIETDVSSKMACNYINRVYDWWTGDFEGKAEKEGEIFTIRFGETYVTFQVVDVIPYKKIRWAVTDSYLHWLDDKKEWNGTFIDWDVSEKNGKTTIGFKHIGLVPEIACYENCAEGWSFYIKESLWKLIREGKGKPNTPRALRSDN